MTSLWLASVDSLKLSLAVGFDIKKEHGKSFKISNKQLELVFILINVPNSDRRNLVAKCLVKI